MDLDGDADADAALMAQMGFSSFGTQHPPQKKRRYNPRADASSSAPAAPSSATGANSTALAPRPPAPTTNTDEIDLDDDDDAAPAADSAQVRPSSLPQRPAPGTGFVGAASHGGGMQQGQRQRGDGPRTPWPEACYDPSFNQNPWEKLEKARGLKPTGSWIPRGADAASSSRP